ncbi:unnamed protein product, partial [Cyprideis torosa]
ASSLSPLTSGFLGLPPGPEDERGNRTSRAHTNSESILEMGFAGRGFIANYEPSPWHQTADFSESLSRGCNDQRASEKNQEHWGAVDSGTNGVELGPGDSAGRGVILSLKSGGPFAGLTACGLDNEALSCVE